MSQESRRRGMAGLSTEALQIAETGKLLGRLVREHFAPTLDAFIRMVVEPPHPLLNVVVNVAYTRSPLRLEGGDTLLVELQRTPRRRRTELLLKDAWATYRALLHHAVPHSPQPVVGTDDVPLEMTRSVSRFLAPSGIRPEHEDWRRDVRRSRADERIGELWGAMAGRGCVLWYDNFWKRQLTSNPSHPIRTYNCTVMAVMRTRTRSLATFPGYPSLEQRPGGPAVERSRRP